MTLGNTPMKPTYPNRCHHVYLGWASSDVIKVGMLAVDQDRIISVLLGQFVQGRHKGDIMGYAPPNSFITSVSFWGVSWYSSVLRSRWLLILTALYQKQQKQVISTCFELIWPCCILAIGQNITISANSAISDRGDTRVFWLEYQPSNYWITPITWYRLFWYRSVLESG